MSSYMKRALIAFLLAVAIAPAAHAQATENSQGAQASGDDYVAGKGFKNRIFDIKNADPNLLLVALRPLGSGFRGATMVVSQELKTLTVRDFPENIATIEEALRRLDVAPPASPNIELRMHVLIGSNTDASSESLPAELKDVVTQLRAMLNYKGYSLMSSMIERTRTNTRAFLGNGVAEVGAPLAATGKLSIPFEYKIEGVSLGSNATGATVVNIKEISFSTTPTQQLSHMTRVSTSVGLRDGEKVVLGTASLRDTSLIIVLSAKLLP